jgi:secreted PhoX family phosphatase
VTPGRPTAGGARPEPGAPASTDTDSSATQLAADGSGLLDLPDGFSYRVLSRFGEKMSDGFRVPGRPDAMACFPGENGTLVLMRNHEVFEGDTAISPYFDGQSAPPEAYDPQGTAGVTRLVLDAETLDVRHSNLALAGTYWNCAGGVSPWGWLSCEETVSAGHGYVFLCRTDSDVVRPHERIPGYGRMRHEAATVHPDTRIAYLTEDRPDGCLYRFVPDDDSEAFRGRLQALRIAGKPNFDTSALQHGQSLEVDWVTIERPDPDDDSVRREAATKGAARVLRGEGLWLGGDDVFFTATEGGAIGRGQILRLSLGKPDRLSLLAESSDTSVLDMPDNLCISPAGALYVCEDGFDGNSLRRVTLDGRITDFARNARRPAELAGVCFSPDGRTLFVNVQEEGLTVAIRGPFDEDLDADGGSTMLRTTPIPPDWPRGARGVGTGLAMLALAALMRRKRKLVGA